jgi:hypothetical protein
MQICHVHRFPPPAPETVSYGGGGVGGLEGADLNATCAACQRGCRSALPKLPFLAASVPPALCLAAHATHDVGTPSSRP